MTERISIRLVNAQQGHAALMALWPRLKALLMAEHRLSLEVKPETRSSAQNRLLHSSLQDVARQALGIAKYGQTVADNPLSLRQWLQHALEECLDQAVYLRRAIAEIDAREAGPCDA